MIFSVFSDQFAWSESLKKNTKNAKKQSGPKGLVFVFGYSEIQKVAEKISSLAPDWQKDTLIQSGKEVLHFVSSEGPVWIVCMKARKGPSSHAGRLEDSVYSWHRDVVGGLLAQWKSSQLKEVALQFVGSDEDIERGSLVGLNLAAYQFKEVFEGKKEGTLPQIRCTKLGGSFSKKMLSQVRAESLAVNLARHLVNLPPNYLNPKTMCEWAQSVHKSWRSLKLEIWDEKRLKKEGMGLHLGVGQGALHPPAMVHLKYRPQGGKKAPIAFVGKGITFDSGGLDIKPSSGMRLMKKDMGGAAAVLGLALWAAESKYSQPLDFYLALAENSVDAKSMRPSDVLTARNGLKVEIHNTDAEGRLVLADVIDVAVTQKGKDEPEAVINVATLTGAIKVALGADVAGLFSNHDELAEQLNEAGQKAGDLNWRMPLVSKYGAGMSSNFADIVNALDGFGGSITAALFLEKFVRQKPWAHLDVYCWTDKPTGSLSFAGGSGQPVQCLIEYLKGRV
jgi:leucyl aminopeptidase